MFRWIAFVVNYLGSLGEKAAFEFMGKPMDESRYKIQSGRWHEYMLVFIENKPSRSRESFERRKAKKLEKL